MLELGLSGSVRGVPSNGHPYRDPGSEAGVLIASPATLALGRCTSMSGHGWRPVGIGSCGPLPD